MYLVQASNTLHARHLLDVLIKLLLTVFSLWCEKCLSYYSSEPQLIGFPTNLA